MSIISAIRYHDISCGHRVVGHENKCAHLHGHNYRIHFTCEAQALDKLGRVIDFSEIKSRLCMWLEDHWDHKMLLWQKDPLAPEIEILDPDGLVLVPFNPTAENMALYLLHEIGPRVLPDGLRLIKVLVDETRKCSASAEI